jgi:hypothetical protein
MICTQAEALDMVGEIRAQFEIMLDEIGKFTLASIIDQTYLDRKALSSFLV